MTDLDAVQANIEKARTIYRKANSKLIEAGVLPIDSAIAALYAAFDIATDVHGGRSEGLAWMGDVVAQFERQLSAETRH